MHVRNMPGMIGVTVAASTDACPWTAALDLRFYGLYSSTVYPSLGLLSDDELVE